MDISAEIQKYRQEIKSERMDMSFGEIMNIYQDGDILISPEFQRLFRWSDYQKTRFIESVLLGIPIPPIFVSEDVEGKWELVDGLQRLSTILSFFGLLKNDIKNKNNFKDEDFLMSYAADRLSIALPLYAGMTNEEFDYVISNIKEALK